MSTVQRTLPADPVASPAAAVRAGRHPSASARRSRELLRLVAERAAAEAEVERDPVVGRRHGRPANTRRRARPWSRSSRRSTEARRAGRRAAPAGDRRRRHRGRGRRRRRSSPRPAARSPPSSTASASSAKTDYDRAKSRGRRRVRRRARRKAAAEFAEAQTPDRRRDEARRVDAGAARRRLRRLPEVRPRRAADDADPRDLPSSTTPSTSSSTGSPRSSRP